MTCGLLSSQTISCHANWSETLFFEITRYVIDEKENGNVFKKQEKSYVL